MPALVQWIPAAVLTAGALVTLGVDTQRPVPLRVPLASAIPAAVDGLEAVDLDIAEWEQRLAGMTDYVYRAYQQPGDSTSAPAFSLYVGYYDQQVQGKTIHSPKNCLPGSGWEALASRRAQITTPTGVHPVNRYLIQRGKEQSLVLYWYQGRGRVEANEYVVKWNLLRDAAFHGRSEEALVRIVVTMNESTPEDQAFELASTVAGRLIPALQTVLPS